MHFNMTFSYLFLLYPLFILAAVQASHKGYVQTDIESNFVREEVRTWKVPAHLRNNYVYYWSGFDEEGRPLWVLELGKWDIKSIVLNGNKTLPEFNKYVDNATFNVLQSLGLNSSDPTAPTQIVGIVDMEHFAYSQLASVPTLQYIVKMFSYLVPVMYKYVSHGYLVNSNFYAQKLIDLVRPILGPVMERVEVYGTDKTQWIPRMLKVLPRDQLPEWYGGNKNFAPVKAFGK